MKCFFSLLFLVFLQRYTHASITITATESNGDVIFQLNDGDYDLSGIPKTGSGTISSNSFINAKSGYVAMGASSLVDTYSGTISGPTNFGVGSGTIATSTSGVRFEFQGNFDALRILKDSPTVGNLGTGTMTFDSATFNSLGISSGTYTWTWGSATENEKLVLTVVPEPHISASIVPARKLDIF